MSTTVNTMKSNLTNGTSSQRVPNSGNVMVNGLQNRQSTQTIGRYTVLSKSTSTTTGGGTLRNTSNKGFYHPASHYTNLDGNKRSHSQQNVGRNQFGGINNQCSLNNKSNDCLNGPTQHHISSSAEKLNSPYPTKYYSDVQHTKSHSISSTVLLRDQTGQNYSGTNNNHNTDLVNNYPVSVNTTGLGGSLSCGQPSPSASSSVEDTNLSPNSTSHQNRSVWKHQSAVTLTTDWDDNSSDLINSYKQNSNQNCYQSKQNYQLDNTHSVSTTMLYGQRSNHTEDYINAYPTGPSYRKIQNLHGATNNQKRYPSDTTLNITTRDGAQIYTSGSRPGPVTIPARSRSVQASPGTSPISSPVAGLRVSDNNLNSYNHCSSANTQMKLQKMNLNFQQGNASGQKTNSFPINGHDDDSESQILPSVREIIRQVEAMTQSNATTSSTDIVGASQQNTALHTNGFTRQSSQTTQRRSNNQSNTMNSISNNFGMNLNDQTNRNGIVRPTTGSSQRTPSAPQMRSGNYYNPNGPATAQYTPLQAKFNATVTSNAAKPNAPPVPPHGTNRNKQVIGPFNRRNDDSNSAHKQDFVTSNNIPKKSELLSHLPTDYQKLREAFIEQRREIQRLRKQLAEKDLQIGQLERDIRLYEPWR